MGDGDEPHTWLNRESSWHRDGQLGGLQRFLHEAVVILFIYLFIWCGGHILRIFILRFVLFVMGFGPQLGSFLCFWALKFVRPRGLQLAYLIVLGIESYVG